MADQNKLNADVRSSFGKGAARKIRATDKIPAVIYGHGTEPQHVTLPGSRDRAAAPQVERALTLDIEGDKQLVLVKDVQKDPVRQLIEHIDLIVVRKGEKVTVDVPVHVEGESAPGTIHVVDHNTLTVEAEATHIPERSPSRSRASRRARRSSPVRSSCPRAPRSSPTPRRSSSTSPFPPPPRTTRTRRPRATRPRRGRRGCCRVDRRVGRVAPPPRSVRCSGSRVARLRPLPTPPPGS